MFKRKEKLPETANATGVWTQATSSSRSYFGIVPRFLIGGITLLGLFLFNTTIPAIQNVLHYPAQFPSGELTRQIAYAIGEALGLLLLLGIVLKIYILPLIRREPIGAGEISLGKKSPSVAANSTTDWKKFRIDD